MLALGQFVRTQGWWVLMLLAASGIGLHLALRRPALRERWDGAWLTLPVLGSSRAATTQHALPAHRWLCSPAPGPHSESAAGIGSRHVAQPGLAGRCARCLVMVREGAPWPLALAQKKRFPASVAMFARLGEQTGQLPTMLDRCAKQLGTEVQRRALQLATLLEPLLIVAMA